MAEQPGRIIKAKLTPPTLPAGVIRRGRLDRLLESRIAGFPIVVVYATAGAGKTTAVAQATQSLDVPVAWLTLDASDAAPGRLLTYLEAAVTGRAPAARGVARAALAAGLSHQESAGLLAEALADVELVLVIDDLERLASSGVALDVIAGFARYLPPSVSLLLISRQETLLELRGSNPVGRIAAIGEAELAFTPEEAAQALSERGADGIDAVMAVEATAGWVTGVLFEAWRSDEHVPGMGGEADPLYGYLSSQILGQLRPAEVELLVSTSPLDIVTPRRAEALGVRGAGPVLAALRSHRLPVTWSHRGLEMKAHRRFREYLLARLERRERAQVEALRRRHGELLVREGHAEEGVDELLEGGASAETAAAAASAIGAVVERLDFDKAERWLKTLPLSPRESTDDAFTVAEAMLAMGRDRYEDAVEVADRLGRARLASIASGPSKAASIFAWSFWHVGRLADARRTLDAAPEGRDVRVVWRLLDFAEGGRGAPVPARLIRDGGPLEGLLLRIAYYRGRLQWLVEDAPHSPWAAAMCRPGTVGALRALGRIEDALRLYRSIDSREVALPGASWLHGIIAPELMIDLGRRDEAALLLEEGRSQIAATGSKVLDYLSHLVEAKLRLRLDRDPQAAERLIVQVGADENPCARYAFLRELSDTWLGLALLLQGRDRQARECLHAAVAGMLEGDRVLELPTAAVYLAEAEWRIGDEDASDRAADAAIRAATQQGSNHLLLQALAEYPAVASRRIDAELDRDSGWHEIGRALIAHPAPTIGGRFARVTVKEFGCASIVIDGSEVRPRIKKSVELLAYLLSRAEASATRSELLDALFDGRSDRSARAYLRQAVHRLREVLPAELAPLVDRGQVTLPDPQAVGSEAAQFQALVDEAARLQGHGRLEALRDALRLVAAGTYLPSVDTEWVDERRHELAASANDARLDAATLAFEHGRYAEANEQLEGLLERDRFREEGWRLAMSLADAVGDEDGVLGAYRRCQDALAVLGLGPSSATREHLRRLRYGGSSTGRPVGVGVPS